MTSMNEVRRNRLKELIDEKFDGNQAKFSRAVGKKPTQIWQILNSKKNLGETLAREFETTLGYPLGMLDRSEPHEDFDVYPEGFKADWRQVPIISWTTAGGWGDLTDPFPPGAADDYLQASGAISKHSFALLVNGDSMEPSIRDGSYIVVDPDTQWENKDIVVVRQNDDSEATVKRIIRDGSHTYLKPDNPQYPAMEVAEDATVVGKVVQEIRKF